MPLPFLIFNLSFVIAPTDLLDPHFPSYRTKHGRAVAAAVGGGEDEISLDHGLDLWLLVTLVMILQVELAPAGDRLLILPLVLVSILPLQLGDLERGRAVGAGAEAAVVVVQVEGVEIEPETARLQLGEAAERQHLVVREDRLQIEREALRRTDLLDIAVGQRDEGGILQLVVDEGERRDM